MNTCVGYNNYRYFYLFLLYVASGSAIIFVMTVRSVLVIHGFYRYCILNQSILHA